MNGRIAFGDNLKYYRERRGLTQKRLAEMIGYTEKSISKWENGNGLPTLEMVAALADLFHISLMELVYEKTPHRYFLGIDGGGTKTAFRLVDENGTVLRTVYKGPSNPNDMGLDKALDVLSEGIHESCREISCARISVYAGISGGGLTGNNAAHIAAFLQNFGFYACGNGSDMENLTALAEQKDCILAIMGTGFIVYAIKGDVRHRIAGWGQFFDDGGSGYTLGRDAICAALRATDGSGPETMLCELLAARLGETVEAHLAAFYREGKKYIAGMADIVFTAAETGDIVAKQILDRNMAYVAKMIDTAAEKIRADEMLPVYFSGGVSARHEMLFPLIEKHLQAKNCRLTYLENVPVDGAVRHAMRLYTEKAQKEG